MAIEFNYDDWMNAFHAWEVLENVLSAKSFDETTAALRGITPEVRDRLLDVVSKLRMAVPAEAEEDNLPERALRFPRRDTVYTNLMNIACYRCMRDDEERTAAGKKGRLPIPYGVEDSASMRMKIENYRWAYTHGARGIPGSNTKTIRYLVEFGPTDVELDEAAEYYQNNPE